MTAAIIIGDYAKKKVLHISPWWDGCADGKILAEKTTISVVGNIPKCPARFCYSDQSLRHDSIISFRRILSYWDSPQKSPSQWLNIVSKICPNQTAIFFKNEFSETLLKRWSGYQKKLSGITKHVSNNFTKKPIGFSISHGFFMCFECSSLSLTKWATCDERSIKRKVFRKWYASRKRTLKEPLLI
jgi:hypothetical protein